MIDDVESFSKLDSFIVTAVRRYWILKNCPVATRLRPSPASSLNQGPTRVLLFERPNGSSLFVCVLAIRWWFKGSRVAGAIQHFAYRQGAFWTRSESCTDMVLVLFCLVCRAEKWHAPNGTHPGILFGELRVWHFSLIDPLAPLN